MLPKPTNNPYTVFVDTGVGGQLMPIGFDHEKVNIAEIAAYCVEHNCGFWLTEHDYEDEFGCLEDADERFIYVDISGFGYEFNVMLCVENLHCDNQTEIFC